MCVDSLLNRRYLQVSGSVRVRRGVVGRLIRVSVRVRVRARARARVSARVTVSDRDRI